MKSEPDVFGIDHLRAKGVEHWDGVRNYQARNFMRDEMKVGDLILFHHSNAKPPGVAGVARVVREAYPDHTSWDLGSHYFDPKSTPEQPRWFMVDVGYVETFPTFLPLDELRNHEALADMALLNRSRLSVQPVTRLQFDYIVRLGRAAASTSS
jgi:predicted RNA-binding protein with PUA-like domain